jgi:hypothetical protein
MPLWQTISSRPSHPEADREPMPNLKFLWVFVGFFLIALGIFFAETIVALALIPVGVAIMAMGGLRK